MGGLKATVVTNLSHDICLQLVMWDPPSHATQGTRVPSSSMARTCEDDGIIGPRVQNLLREVANLSNLEVQHVFRGVAHFPPVCAAVLNRTTALLTTVFAESREDLKEGSSKPRRQSEQLKKVPPTPERGRSTRNKKKAIGVDNSSEEWQSEEDTGDIAEEDSLYGDDDEEGGDGDGHQDVKATKRSTQTLKKSEVSFRTNVSGF